MDPVRGSATVLAEAAAEGQYSYSSQYLQDPIPAGGGMFKTKKLNYDVPPRLRHFKKLTRFWDKAGSEGEGDWSAGVLIGKSSDDRIWVLDVKRFQEEAAERERIILETADNDLAVLGKLPKVNVRTGVEQEPGSSGKESADATVQMLAGHVAFKKPASGSKTRRAEPFAAQVSAGSKNEKGNVWIARKANGEAYEWESAYVEELKFFPFGKNDDQVDGSSGAFNDIFVTPKQAGVF